MEAITIQLWEPLLAPLLVGLAVAYFKWWLEQQGKK